MHKNYYKLVIFDLDLTLWDGEKLFSQTLPILEGLRQRGILMYIASFHLDAKACCEQLKINHFFDDIYYGRHWKKSDMVTTILQKNNDINANYVLFFDDNIDNIIDVGINTGVKTIHVNKDDGVKWRSIC